MSPIYPAIRTLTPRPAAGTEGFSAAAELRPILARVRDLGVVAELRALEQERDAGLFYEGLMGIAGRQEQAGRLDAAGEIYAAVVAGAADGDAAPAAGAVRQRPLRMRAQRQLDAILGRGAFGPRAEFLLRNLAQQAAEPSAIFAMGAAGAVFRVTRLATLSRLAAASSPGVLTRLLGTGRLASLAGFAVEAPTFTLAARLGSEALGRSQDWRGSAMARDFASSYLLLGGLRVAGWASGAASRGIAGSVGAEHVQPLQALFQQGGMLFGILLGHALEQWTGLRRPQDGATTLVDSLAMLLQFHVAGRLTRQAFGPRVAAWERGLDRQAATLSRMPSLPRLPPLAALELSPGLAMARPLAEIGLRLPDRFFSVGRPETRGPEPAPGPAEPIPEVRASLDGRARAIDRETAPAIKLIEAQGAFWVIDIDTEFRRRDFEVRVGEHLLPPGGSLRVREGEWIRIDGRSFRFREPEREFSPAISSVRSAEGVVVRRHLHIQYSQGREARYELRFQDFIDRMEPGQTLVFASGPQGEARLTLRERRMTAEGAVYGLELRDAATAFSVSIELTPERVILNSLPFPDPASALLPMFTDWLSTETLVRASDLQVRGVTPEIHELLGAGLIHSGYSRFERYGERVDLVTQPRSTLLPSELGPAHREAAQRAFDAWALRKFGTRIPNLIELEAGAALPEFNHLGLEASMPAILDRLIRSNTRFLEIGFGDRLETLQAVERRGGLAWGLELDRVYPPEANRETLRRSDLDVLFVNGSPFLFYAQHHVALPAAVDILRQFPRAEWLVIQAYNPRTPFEILRHAEELNRLRWEPLYFRVAPSLDEAPIFPTDWCSRPDTAHSLMIARRVTGENIGLTTRY